MSIIRRMRHQFEQVDDTQRYFDSPGFEHHPPLHRRRCVRRHDPGGSHCVAGALRAFLNASQVDA